MSSFMSSVALAHLGQPQTWVTVLESIEQCIAAANIARTLTLGPDEELRFPTLMVDTSVEIVDFGGGAFVRIETFVIGLKQLEQLDLLNFAPPYVTIRTQFMDLVACFIRP